MFIGARVMPSVRRLQSACFQTAAHLYCRFMKKRPTSVTVIAWILLVISALSLLGSTMAITNPMAQEMMAKSPIPIPLQYVMLILGCLLKSFAPFSCCERRTGHAFFTLLGAGSNS